MLAVREYNCTVRGAENLKGCSPSDRPGIEYACALASARVHCMRLIDAHMRHACMYAHAFGPWN
eukprot:1895268-Pleurochrysis_carterae.AAC.1